MLVFRAEDCDREGLLGQLVTVDLFGVDRDTARDRLVGAVRGERLKPEVEPLFPPMRGEVAPSGNEPRFPRPPVVWAVPWPRNPNFTGRANISALNIPVHHHCSDYAANDSAWCGSW